MSSPATSTPPRLLVVGPRVSGKTRHLIAHASALLDAGVPARRLLIVTFSPRVASQIGVHLPIAEDKGAPGGVWVQTVQRLCARLLRDSQRVVRHDRDVRIISAFERATLLQVAVRQVAGDLGPDHPLTPALTDTGGLAEIEVLLEAVAGQGGTPADLERACRDIGGLVPALDAAVLEGVVGVYQAYRGLRERVGGLTYQEVAAEAAAALADPVVAAAMARRIDYLLIDDLERAEPAQIDVLAHLAMSVPVFATLDPAGIFSDRALRSLELARRLLGLDPDQPTEVLTPPPVPSPALAGLRDRLTQASIAGTEPALLPSTVACSSSLSVSTSSIAACISSFPTRNSSLTLRSSALAMLSWSFAASSSRLVEAKRSMRACTVACSLRSRATSASNQNRPLQQQSYNVAAGIVS